MVAVDSYEVVVGMVVSGGGGCFNDGLVIHMEKDDKKMTTDGVMTVNDKVIMETTIVTNLYNVEN